MADPKTIVAAVMSAAAAASMALGLATSALQTDEGKRNTGYFDPARIPTDCFGHTGPDVVVGKRKTDAQCADQLQHDTDQHMKGVLRCTPSLAGHPYQLAAATRLTFNIGVPAYCGSTAARKFKAGDWHGACDAFLPWHNITVSKPIAANCTRRATGGYLCALPGLVSRRARERAMCLTGL